MEDGRFEGFRISVRCALKDMGLKLSTGIIPDDLSGNIVWGDTCLRLFARALIFMTEHVLRDDRITIAWSSPGIAPIVETAAHVSSRHGKLSFIDVGTVVGAGGEHARISYNMARGSIACLWEFVAPDQGVMTRNIRLLDQDGCCVTDVFSIIGHAETNERLTDSGVRIHSLLSFEKAADPVSRTAVSDGS